MNNTDREKLKLVNDDLMYFMGLSE